MQIIEKEEVATEYLLESSVAEDDKSDHGIKTEVNEQISSLLSLSRKELKEKICQSK